jgi:hypothetical protein
VTASNAIASARRAAIVGLLLSCTAFVSTAAAQGKGNGNANGHGKKQGAAIAPSQGATMAPSAAGAPDLPAGTGVRNFGSWLDDASVMSPGEGAMSFSFGYFRTPAYRELDLPALDGTVGITRRVQFGVSAPLYYAGEPGGPAVRGLGDVYLTGKVQLLDPSATSRRIGFAVIPVVEVLTYAPRPGAGRVSWALPASVELRGERWRTYGSAGYFSRGSLFASGALEVALSDAAWVTGSISQSHSIAADDLSTALGLSPNRTDISGGVGIIPGPGMAVFTSIGRTISAQDANSTSLFLIAGVSFSFDVWSGRKPLN